MKYDKSLKSKEDKKLWVYLQSGIFEDIKDECNFRKDKMGWTMKQLVDCYRPIYGSCDGDVDISGLGFFDMIRMKDRLEKAAIKKLDIHFKSIIIV